MSLKRRIARNQEAIAKARVAAVEDAILQRHQLETLLFLSTEPRNDLAREARGLIVEELEKVCAYFDEKDPTRLFVGMLIARAAYDEAEHGASPTMGLIDTILEQRMVEHGVYTSAGDPLQDKVQAAVEQMAATGAQ
jgi:hypothetical protein